MNMASEGTGSPHQSSGVGAIPGMAPLSGFAAFSPRGLTGGFGRERELDPATTLENRRALVLMSLRDTSGRGPIAEQIFDELAIEIVEGRLRPGETLNSVELAQRFGTSRTPVREALAGLEHQGVVVVPHRRRPYVAHATLQEIKDIYDVRANLFSLASELIIDNCAVERLAELWRWQAALEEDAANDAVEDYFWHNVGFRLVEVRLSGNEVLQRIVGTLGVRTLQFRHVSLSEPGRIKSSVEEHRRLLLAYEAGDKVTASMTTRALIMNGFRALQRSNVLTDPATPPVSIEEESS